MIDQLKEQIFFKIGKEIVNRGDCEHLSRLIEIDTGEYLNYNTLRRFFNIDKQTFKPRTSTLDILSKYIGYLSFDHFSSFKPQRVYFDQNLKMYGVLNDFDPEQLSAFFNDLDANYNLRLTFVIQVCRHGLLSNQITELCAALDLMHPDVKSFSYDEMLIIGNSVGLMFRKISFTKKEWKCMLTNAFFNEYVFEIFVDYSSLNAYYFSFIKHKPFDDKQRYFKLELMILYHFLNKELPPRKLLANDPVKSDGLNPILHGRMLCKHLYLGTANLEMIKAMESLKIEHLYEPMVATILSSNFIWFDFIHGKLNHLLKGKYFRNIHYFQVYLLMKACFYYKSNEIDKAAMLLNEMNLEDFRFSYRELLSFFYYLLDYKLNNNNDSRMQAEYLSQKLRYPRFNEGYIRSY